MWISGIILLIGSLAALFAVMNSDATVIRNVGIVIIIAHALMVFGTIILSEIALRKNFDSEGNRKG
jgi:hypothetical protein